MEAFTQRWGPRGTCWSQGFQGDQKCHPSPHKRCGFACSRNQPQVRVGLEGIYLHGRGSCVAERTLLWKQEPRSGDPQLCPDSSVAWLSSFLSLDLTVPLCLMIIKAHLHSWCLIISLMLWVLVLGSPHGCYSCYVTHLVEGRLRYRISQQKVLEDVGIT